jgi:hypothetical protein
MMRGGTPNVAGRRKPRSEGLEPKEVMTEAEAIDVDALKAASGLFDERQIASARMHRETPRTIRAQPHPELGLVSLAVVYETRAEVFMLEPWTAGPGYFFCVSTRLEQPIELCGSLL